MIAQFCDDFQNKAVASHRRAPVAVLFFIRVLKLPKTIQMFCQYGRKMYRICFFC